MFILLPLVATIIASVSADSRNIGKCPHIDPQQHFEMQKFLGEWYAIQRTNTDVPCLTYNITEKKGHPGYYHFTESHPNSQLAQLVGLGPENKKNGELCAVDEKHPAIMDLSLPYEIGTSKFTVFMTDYDNYAAIFVCKTYPLTFNRLRKWSAQILSRTPTLDIEYVEKIRTRLSAYNVDPFTLSRINQHHCEHHDNKHEKGGAPSPHVPKADEDLEPEKGVVQTSGGKVEDNLITNSNAYEKPDVFEMYDAQAVTEKKILQEPISSYA